MFRSVSHRGTYVSTASETHVGWGRVGHSISLTCTRGQYRHVALLNQHSERVNTGSYMYEDCMKDIYMYAKITMKLNTGRCFERNQCIIRSIPTGTRVNTDMLHTKLMISYRRRVIASLTNLSERREHRNRRVTVAHRLMCSDSLNGFRFRVDDKHCVEQVVNERNQTERAEETCDTREHDESLIV